MIDKEKIYTDTDTQLMLQVKHGDTEAYENLYQKHHSKISNFFKNVGNADGWSEDLAQKVFTYIWKNRESFRAESTFKTYMYSIAKRILHKHIRKLDRDAKIFKNARVSHVKTELSEPEAAYSLAELLTNLEMNKSKLSKKQRQAIELLLDPGYSPETAAKMADCSKNTYRQRLFATRRILEKFLKNKNILIF